MEPFDEPSLSFCSGFSLGINKGLVLAHLGSHNSEFPKSQIMEWSHDEGWNSYEINLSARRISVLSEPENQIIVMGAGGFVAIMKNGKITEEMVDESDTGPRLRGNIRDMRLIGSHLYATGMNRQVYRREGAMRWTHCDRGVVQPLGTLKVTGFSAIDGSSESDIYASGFNGEIWHYDGQNWYQIDTPTNLILHSIRVVKPDLVFACGQQGVLLQGHHHTWKSVEHTVTTENFWGIEWFEECLYIAGDNFLYCLDRDQLKVVDTGLKDSFTYRHLHANNNAMWSFGPKHIAKTDGKTWTDITPT